MRDPASGAPKGGRAEDLTPKRLLAKHAPKDVRREKRWGRSGSTLRLRGRPPKATTPDSLASHPAPKRREPVREHRAPVRPRHPKVPRISRHNASAASRPTPAEADEAGDPTRAEAPRSAATARRHAPRPVAPSSRVPASRGARNREAGRATVPLPEGDVPVPRPTSAAPEGTTGAGQFRASTTAANRPGHPEDPRRSRPNRLDHTGNAHPVAPGAMDRELLGARAAHAARRVARRVTADQRRRTPGGHHDHSTDCLRPTDPTTSSGAPRPILPHRRGEPWRV